MTLEKATYIAENCFGLVLIVKIVLIVWLVWLALLVWFALVVWIGLVWIELVFGWLARYDMFSMYVLFLCFFVF